MNSQSKKPPRTELDLSTGKYCNSSEMLPNHKIDNDLLSPKKAIFKRTSQSGNSVISSDEDCSKFEHTFDYVEDIYYDSRENSQGKQ
jgi:hypothetical protein